MSSRIVETPLAELQRQWHAKAVIDAQNDIQYRAGWLQVELTRPEPNSNAIRAMFAQTRDAILSFWYLREGCPTYDDIPQTYPWSQMSDSTKHYARFCELHRDQLQGMTPSELAKFAGADK